MRQNWKQIALINVALVVATVAAYCPVFRADFVTLDDKIYAYQNLNVLQGLSFSGWRYAWTSFDGWNWHPLTWLTLQLDASIWGKSPYGFHLTNLIIHVLNELLLFAVLYRATADILRSACVAGLFALHPLHVESVAWISERKDVLCTFFLLLTLLAYLRYCARAGVANYLLVVGMFACGLMSKPMLVTLPILLSLLDWWPLCRCEQGPCADGEPRFQRRSIGFLLVEKSFLLMLAFADGVATIAAQRTAIKVLEDVPFSVRLANALNAYAWYLWKTFVPVDLIVFYIHPERNVTWLQIAVGATLVVGISVWTLWPTMRRTRPYLAVGWFWFVISLLPVIGLLQVGNQAYADRYAYIPHIGLFVAIVWGIRTSFVSPAVGRMLFSAISLIAIGSCGWLTYQQATYWQNSITLWNHALTVDPDNPMAHSHLADIRFEERDYAAAIAHLELGLKNERIGFRANGFNLWGLSLMALGRSAEAEGKFVDALKIDRNLEPALESLSKLLRSQGRTTEAARYADRYASAKMRRLQGQPDSAEYQMLLGFTAVKQGDLANALSRFEKAIELAPKSATARFNLALVQRHLNRNVEAKANLKKVIELDPTMAAAHVDLANILESENDINGAIEHLTQAVQLNPGDPNLKARLDRLTNR